MVGICQLEGKRSTREREREREKEGGGGEKERERRGERERSDILITGIIMKLRVITDYELVERPVMRNFTRECILNRAPSSF